MDESRDHHVKLNKPDSERQILHVFFHMWNLDIKKGWGGYLGSWASGEGEKRGLGENMIEVYCMHTWKGHNEPIFLKKM
jgi:hypothetical protein